jgi:hypothetical protein
VALPAGGARDAVLPGDGPTPAALPAGGAPCAVLPGDGPAPAAPPAVGERNSVRGRGPLAPLPPAPGTCPLPAHALLAGPVSSRPPAPLAAPRDGRPVGTGVPRTCPVAVACASLASLFA